MKSVKQDHKKRVFAIATAAAAAHTRIRGGHSNLYFVWIFNMFFTFWRKHTHTHTKPTEFQFIFTWTGSSKTPEQIGQTNSSSTSPWNRVSSYPISYPRAAPQQRKQTKWMCSGLYSAFWPKCVRKRARANPLCDNFYNLNRRAPHKIKLSSRRECGTQPRACLLTTTTTTRT